MGSDPRGEPGRSSSSQRIAEGNGDQREDRDHIDRGENEDNEGDKREEVLKEGAKETVGEGFSRGRRRRGQDKVKGSLRMTLFMLFGFQKGILSSNLHKAIRCGRVTVSKARSRRAILGWR